MRGFWIALCMDFFTELGDKTQLVALTFATRYKPLVVLAGVAAGSAASQAISAFLGGVVGKLLPVDWVKVLAGLAFLAFGAWTMRGEDDNDEDSRSGKRISPFWLVTSTFFLAEMGDKTMLGNIALSATYSPVLIFLGGTAGMVLSDGLAILIGTNLGERLPQRAVKTGAALMFFAFGGWTLFQGIVALYPRAAVAAIAIMAVFAFMAFRKPGPAAESSEAS